MMLAEVAKFKVSVNVTNAFSGGQNPHDNF